MIYRIYSTPYYSALLIHKKKIHGHTGQRERRGEKKIVWNKFEIEDFEKYNINLKVHNEKMFHERVPHKLTTPSPPQTTTTSQRNPKTKIGLGISNYIILLLNLTSTIQRNDLGGIIFWTSFIHLIWNIIVPVG